MFKDSKQVDREHKKYVILISLGAVAQLGERLNGIQEVVGSIPISSTIKINHLRVVETRPQLDWGCGMTKISNR
jgi:hypothetical protein